MIRSGRFLALTVVLALLSPALYPAAAEGAPRSGRAARQVEQQAPVDEARELFRQALQAAREDRWADARSLTDAGLALTPEDADGLNLLGEILERLDDPAGAAVAFESAARHDPQWLVPLMNLARMQLNRQQYRDARRTLDRAIRLAPDRPDLRAWMGVAHRAEESFAQARLAFEQAWEMDPESMALAVDVALARADTGDDAGALEAARRATEIAPDDAGPWMLVGDILARSPENGRRAEAPGAYRRAIARSPGDPLVWMRLAASYRDLALHEESESALRRAVELGADGSRVWLLLARSLVAQSRPADAIELYSRVIDEVPDGAEAHLERGQALFNANRHEEALADVRRALELQPGLAEAYSTGSRILMVMGRMDEAVELTRSALDAGADPAQTNLTLGRLLVRAGRPAEAVDPLQSTMAAAPGLIEARYLLGQALLATGDTERGQTLLAEYQEALRAERDAEAARLQESVADRARIHVVRGRVFSGEERFDDALQQLEAAVELQPDLIEAWQLLAATCDRLGLTERAAEARRRAEVLADPGLGA